MLGTLIITIYEYLPFVDVGNNFKQDKLPNGREAGTLACNLSDKFSWVTRKNCRVSVMGAGEGATTISWRKGARRRSVPLTQIARSRPRADRP